MRALWRPAAQRKQRTRTQRNVRSVTFSSALSIRVHLSAKPKAHPHIEFHAQTSEQKRQCSGDPALATSFLSRASTLATL
jgi:hypothetical protein